MASDLRLHPARPGPKERRSAPAVRGLWRHRNTVAGPALLSWAQRGDLHSIGAAFGTPQQRPDALPPAERRLASPASNTSPSRNPARLDQRKWFVFVRLQPD
jgi:hypothetical protein